LLDNEDSVCGIQYNGSAFYFLKNQQGDVIALTDGYGNLLARYTYDAWGKLLSVTDKNGNAITSPEHIAHINPYRYRGYYYDREIGMYYLQSRYYDPEVGRFVNVDEADCLETNDTSVSCNLFTYCEDDPINLKDITGGFSWSIFPKIIKFISGLIGKLSNFLLESFGLSKRKYAHKLKYNNASSLTKFVNNNKKSIKKIGRGFSAVAKCLETIIICSECLSRIKKNVGTSTVKAVASLAFYGTVTVLGKVTSKLVSWILSKVIAALFWAKFIIERIVDTLIDWLLDSKWISRLEAKFVQRIDKNSLSICSNLQRRFLLNLTRGDLIG